MSESLTAPATILVVEDDGHFRETLSDALALKRLKVKGVSSGKDAAEVLETETPSLILMDVQLPDTHGFDLCRRLKRSPRLKNVPIIFLSARYTEPADRAEGLLAGADAYLSKPVNLDVLWEEVNYLLEKSA
ncbi:MAG: response regulator [Elusimicrobia bacterium]|nr:response regulator [Elusimicrobiota bacterium]